VLYSTDFDDYDDDNKDIDDDVLTQLSPSPVRTRRTLARPSSLG
jgi:hypothetical protein